MEPGIFAKTFVRPNLSTTLEAVQAYNFRYVQFNMACAGLPAMPAYIPPELSDTIRREMASRHLSMAAISGTFNMIHPDPKQRQEGLQRLEVLAAACQQLGTSIITLCTGSRDPENMWHHHADNNTPAAWRDLTACMSIALQSAEQHHVTLAIEPEVSNVVNSARQARRLLAEMQSPYLKVVMDGANLFPAGQLPRMPEILAEAFDLLGQDIVLAHAKDLKQDGAAGHEAAGSGLLDYDLYLRLLRQAGYAGPLILHSLSEAQVESSLNFLRQKLLTKDVTL